MIAHLGQADQNLGLTGIAIAHGLAIACFVSAAAAISGGHLNPAVSFGLWLARKIDATTFGAYVVSQLIGGILGAFAARFCLPGMATQFVAGGTPALGKGVTVGQGIFAEAITTFFLVYVVLLTGVDRRAPKMAGIFIGFAIILDILAIGPLTGGAMNPARYFGPAIVAGGAAFDNWIVWLAGPLIGGAVAAAIYGLFLEHEPEKAA